MKKFLKTGIPAATRAFSAYEYFVNNDKKTGRGLLEKAKKDAANFPNKGFQLMEGEYLRELEKIMNSSSVQIAMT